MRIIKLTVSLLLATLALSAAVRAAETASVHAILIMATNEKTAADPKLAPYEAELQRNAPESSFRFVAERSATVAVGGRTTISLGGGHRLEVEREKGGALRLKMQWFNEAKSVIGPITVNAQSGVPIMLGNRPPGDGQVPIVLVIAK
jgi:hypothetical protein